MCLVHRILHHNLCLLCQQVQLLINHPDTEQHVFYCFVLPSVTLPEVTKPCVVYQPALHYTVSKQVYEAITVPELYAEILNAEDALAAQIIKSKYKNFHFYKGDNCQHWVMHDCIQLLLLLLVTSIQMMVVMVSVQHYHINPQHKNGLRLWHITRMMKWLKCC